MPASVYPPGLDERGGRSGTACSTTLACRFIGGSPFTYHDLRDELAKFARAISHFDDTGPLYIPYTSDPTGRAKGIVHDTGHAVGLKCSMRNIYDVEPGEVYWAASDVIWVVGHCYIVYGPLLHGCTTVLAFRAIGQQDPDGAHIKRYDLFWLRTLFLARKRCDPESLRLGRT